MRKTLAGVHMLALGAGLVLFQNCAGFDSSSDAAGSVPKQSAGLRSFAHELPTFQSMSDLALWRKRAWSAKCGENSEWDVCFEGKDLPGDNQGAHLTWDNPVDDDWELPEARELSWLTNQSDGSAADYMRIDRTVVGVRNYSGHFWRRDEFLSAAGGFEAEFRIRILSHSQAYGVMLHFFDDRHQFKIHFAPDRITFHPYIGEASGTTATQVRRNTSMTKFKVRKAPDSGIVTLWAEDVQMFRGNVLSPATSDGMYMPSTAVGGRIVARIGLGDNNNKFDDQMGGAFDADYFRYRRADLTSGARVPPPLPSPSSCPSSVSWQTVRNVQSGTPITTIVNLGSMVADVSEGHFGRSLEFDVRLLSDSPDGFSLEYFDRLGGILLTVFPDRLEIKAGTKPVRGFFVSPSGFNGRDLNRLRLVRSSNGLYWNLYLNENSLPLMVDVRASGISPDYRGLLFGPYVMKSLSELIVGEMPNPRSPTNAVAEVALVRLMDHAIAPLNCQ